MIALIWVTLIFSLRNSNADAGGSLQEETSCLINYCVTLTPQITAEAGLCAVIPCSFTTPYYFKPRHIVWYKCESEKPKCGDTDIIFHSNKDNNKTPTGFVDRVSQLEPDVSHGNCSIIINDLRESDSGSYQFRVNGLKSGSSDGFTFPLRTIVSVKGLSQTPTVTVPPLTAGQQNTVTCTAPGLCSGSAPTFTWRWRKPGGTHSHITGNITAVTTEDVSAVTQRHSSTLTFDLSAEHHGTEVTCEVSFTGDVKTEETVTLNVSYVQEIRVSGNTTVAEGETLNLSCTVDSFPPSFLTWTKSSDRDQNTTEPQQHVDEGAAALSITNVRAEHAGRYICTAKHLDSTRRREADVTVTYMREPEVRGNTTVKEGEALNLTCRVESSPPALVTWTKRGFNRTLNAGTDSEQQNNAASASLFIPEATEETRGRYVCTVQQRRTAVAVHADVQVLCLPRILQSHCELRADVLTCVCVAQASPLAAVRWPLLEKHRAYSVITSVSDLTVNSSVTVAVSDHSHASVECVAINANGEAKRKLSVRANLTQQEVAEQNRTLQKVFSRLETVVAFLVGVLLSTLVCCLVKSCHRRKRNRSAHLDETLQMVSTPEDPLIYDGPAGQYEQIQVQRGQNGSVAPEQSAAECDGGTKDVEYASIDLSLLNRRNPGREAKRESTRTEYAEVKREVKEERRDEDGAEEEMLEEEEEEETQDCVPEEEQEEETAVYSSVKDLMGEM